MDKQRKVKRKLTPIGKLLVFIAGLTLIALLLNAFGIFDKKDKDTGKDKNKAEQTIKYDSDEFMPKVIYAKKTKDTAKLKTDSQFGILINLDKNEIVATKNGDERFYPASMTKIMTLLVAVENMESLDDTFTFTNEVIDPLVMENLSRAGFESGEEVTVKDMLYGCVLPSGADATYGLAVTIAGSEREFVKLMNDKANSLGLKNTHFVNVSGLHDDRHYSTPHDIALILDYAMQNKTCAEILSTVKYTTAKTPQHPEGIELENTMFSRMYGTEAEDVIISAGKTGYTTESGNCLASYAENADGEKFILVTGKASNFWKSIYDALNTYSEFCGNGTINIPNQDALNY